MKALWLLMGLILYLIGDWHGFEKGRVYEQSARSMTSHWMLNEYYDSVGTYMTADRWN